MRTARGIRRTGDPVSSAWAAGDLPATLAGTPLAGNAEVEAHLAELGDGGLYQRMDEVAKQRLAAVVGSTVAVIAKHESPGKSLERVLPVFRADLPPQRVSWRCSTRTPRRSRGC